MLIAQITDTHIKTEGVLTYRVVDTAAHLVRAVAALNALDPRPDLVIATGDLVDFGRPEEYAYLRRLLAPLEIPLLLVPGNHDDPKALAEAFPDHPYLAAALARHGRISHTVETHPVRLVLLDTVEFGKPGGALGAAQIDWLDSALAEQPDRPTIVALHHPPFDTGIDHMDRIGLSDAAALKPVIARHPQVERLISGHLHRAIQTRFAGTVASTAPSTAHQLALTLGGDAEPGFTLEPPAFQLHLWRDGAGLVSHTQVIGDFPGPFPFFENGALID
jgi:3',5'-cyclic-AMP phosphodiesterase